MATQTDRIMKDDWYKTASEEQMRVALLHLQHESIDALFNELAEKKQEVRQATFEQTSIACGWNEQPNAELPTTTF